jgi:hypothetical protein
MSTSNVLYPTDRPIGLEDDINHQTGVYSAPSRRTQHGQKLSRGYNLRMPIQLRSSEIKEVTTTDREFDGGLDVGGCLEEKMWEYDGFGGYRVAGGVPKVAVHWRITWESAADSSSDKVAEVKEKW